MVSHPTETPVAVPFSYTVAVEAAERQPRAQTALQQLLARMAELASHLPLLALLALMVVAEAGVQTIMVV